MRTKRIAVVVSEQYIIDVIDNSDRNLKPLETDQQRADFLMETFISEFYSHKKHLTVKAAMAEYLAGLPSCCSVDYLPREILNLGYKWKLLDHTSTKDQEDTLIEQWFVFMSDQILSFIDMSTINKF